MGALPPRFAFVLNPYADAGFTKCPRCEAKTFVRKLSLVIHVEDFGLVLLGKTCRLCLVCETLIAHQADVDKLIRVVMGASASPDYVVLGTVIGRCGVGGLEGRVTPAEVTQHMADFRSYLRIEITPAVRYPNPKALANSLGTHPANLAVRFLLEVSVLLIFGLWGWHRRADGFQIVVALTIPLLAAVLWGTFAVPNDPSRSGSAPVPIPGMLRLQWLVGQ